VRLAIGAPAWRLVERMMLESLVVSVTGGVAGIGLAAWALAAGRGLLSETLPLIQEITLNWTVVGFALALAVLTGFLCGLAPGLRHSEPT
jgi:ABC-type antimicrobial peptide transport system permease subunit